MRIEIDTEVKSILCYSDISGDELYSFLGNIITGGILDEYELFVNDDGLMSRKDDYPFNWREK